MRKIHFIGIFLFFLCFSLSAQKTILRGNVINSTTKQPVKGVSVQLKMQNLFSFTESNGSFYFDGISPGNEIIEISSPNITTKEVPVNIISGKVNDVGTIELTILPTNVLNEGSFVLLDEETIGEDVDQGDYNVSSMLASSNDVYLSNTAYDLSFTRFKVRGYDPRYSSDIYINGVNFTNPERGGFSYGMIGGLNDATRNEDIVNGLLPSGFTFGQLGGSTNINTNATNYAPGGKASLAYTNRNYKLRGTALYSTGLMSNGWALTGSIAYRWADEGVVEGTFYNSLALFLAAEKVINDKHRLSMTAFAVPTQRGQQSATTMEIANLLDNNLYNSYWGYQDGKKRNARIVTTVEPTFIFSHNWDINRETKLQTGLGFRYSLYGNTAIERYNSRHPSPDYYRNLPSFQTDPQMQELYKEKWLTDPTISQTDWGRFYRENQNANQGGNPAAYVLGERHNDQMNLTFNSTLTTKLNGRVTFTGGLEARTTKGLHYETIADMLGADYFLNVNPFAKRDFGMNAPQIQYDLNDPDKHAVKGDRIRYDYDMYVNNVALWAQNVHRYNKWDIFYAFKIGYTSFYRDGNMKNGINPDNSYGKGTTHSFVDQSAKLGLAYKLSGRHIFSANVSYATLPPLSDNAYISSQSMDTTIPDLKSEQNFSADINYIITTPIIRGRVSAFQTDFYDQTEVIHMYNDLDGTFTHLAMTNIDKIHRGFEVGLEAKVSPNITLSGVGTIAEYYYNSRPTGYVYADNGSFSAKEQTYYLKNYYVGGTPQTAGSFGIHYFHPKYWFADLQINGFNRSYIDISPIRRTEDALNFPAATPEEKEEKVKKITHQEEFGGGYTVDFSIGKSLRIHRKYTLNINLQFNNILNRENIKTGGYENNRFDYVNFTVDERYPSYYYFAQGFNCFLNAGFKF